MFFIKKKDKEIEGIINQIKVDLSNNYKDNAVEGIHKLKEVVKRKSDAGSLKPEQQTEYNKLINEFEDDVRNFKRTY